MKKVFAFLLILVMTVCICQFTASAASGNFIPEVNSKFESGVHSWTVLSGGSISVVNNPNGSGKVLSYSNIPANKSYASCQLDVRSYIQSSVSNATTIYGSIRIYSTKAIQNLIVRIRTQTKDGFSLCKNDGQTYCALTQASVKAGQWNTISFQFNVTKDDLKSKEYWNLCFDGLSRYTSQVYIDDVYLGTQAAGGEYIGNAVIPAKTAVSRFDKTLIGTIRWDVYNKSTATGTDPASQVARVLSPKKYHGQAPFFSTLNNNGTISFPEYTIKTWEAEAAYAVNAGLDYFAYLWYRSDDVMSTARKLHLRSSKKDTIKMSAILERIRDDVTMGELYAAMKDSCFLTLDGRPVVFLYSLGGWTAEQVREVRQGAANAGITKALYIVGMSDTTSPSTFANNVAKDIDAVSWYATGASQTGQSYASLARACEATIKNIASLCNEKKIDLIPTFTAGRDTRARIETGVSWVDGDPNAKNDSDKPYANRYALEPSMTELQQHIENVLNYVSTAKACKTNIVCSYSWNEHEEGGWLCPTLAVDGNNNVIRNADGTIKANTERLDALKAAIKSVNSPKPTATATAKPTVTPTATATAKPTATATAKPTATATQSTTATKAPDTTVATPTATAVAGVDATATATANADSSVDTTATAGATADASVTATAVPDGGSVAATPTSTPTGKSNGFNALYVVIPITVIIALTTTVIIIKKKKN